MSNNKVQLADGTVLIDLTEDTVTPMSLMSGETAHGADGEQITGELALETLGSGYGTCSTEASTTAKVATLDGFNLVTGGMPTISFSADVPSGATLNINGTGAKRIFIAVGGFLGQITAGIIKAGDYVTFVYNGTGYVVQSISRLVRVVSKYGNITSFSVEEVKS